MPKAGSKAPIGTHSAQFLQKINRQSGFQCDLSVMTPRASYLFLDERSRSIILVLGNP
jgi:hypothetical protein